MKTMTDAAERELREARNREDRTAREGAARCKAQRERAEEAERERDDLKRRWEQDNLCGICPYRQAVQTENDRLREALDDLVHDAAWHGHTSPAVEAAEALLAASEEGGKP